VINYFSKKCYIPSLVFAFLVSFIICACELENTWMKELMQEKTISFNTNGGSSVPSQTLMRGERVKRPADPYKTGSVFLDWYKDNGTFLELYDFSSVPQKDMTLYARWNDSEIETPTEPETPKEPPPGTFNSIDELAAWLQAQPVNTAAAPYDVKLKIDSTNDFSAIKTALDNNPSKYVTLDLSESNITTIPDNAFYTVLGDTGYDTKSLVGIILPNTVDSIGNDAFRSCINLASVTMTDNVKSIGKNAFRYTNLTSVIIPNSVTSIGQEAFASCPLTSITIPSRVTTIGQWAFDNCKNLTSVEFKGANTDFAEDAFGSNDNSNDLLARYKDGGAGKYTRASGSALWKPEIFKSIDALKSWLEAQPDNTANTPYSIKLDVTEIINPINGTLDSAVESIITTREKFVNLELIGTFSIIGSSAFSDCLYLTGIAIPNGVTFIENYVFNRCANLTSIIIPNSVTKIGHSEDVFIDCTSLTSVTFERADTDISYAYFPYQDSLQTAYDAGGIGTYIRSTTGTNLNTWTKQP